MESVLDESCGSIELSDDELEMISGGDGCVAGSAQCVEPAVWSEKTQQFAKLLRARLAEAVPAVAPLVTLEVAGQQLLMVSAPL